MKFKKISRVALVAVMLVTASLPGLPCEASKGKELIVRFQVNKKENITPSYCLAIWLETQEGSYVKTLYGSEWLAYGGYTVEGVCPLWVKKSNWVENAIELPDAISGATPAIGPSEMSFEWKKKQFPAGRYIYRIEVHISADYNEIYSGAIEVGKGPTKSEASVAYEPEKHPEASPLLSDVFVTFE